MDKVYNLMQDIYEIHTREKSEVPLVRPKWKEIYNIGYKYYCDNDVEVEFNLPEEKLIINSKEYGFRDEYIIDYPRFTCRGSSDDSKFFHFFFSVMEGDSSAVVIVKSVKIVNYNEIYNSKYRVDVENELDFLGRNEILDYQEIIFRNLGIGMAIKEIEPSKEELDEVGLTRTEFAYSIYDLMINAENFFLMKKFRSYKNGREKIIEILKGIMNDEIADIEMDSEDVLDLDSQDITVLKAFAELKVQNSNRRRHLERNRSRFQMTLEEVSQRVEQLIYFDEVESLKINLNVMQTLKEYGFDIEDVNICEVTTKLVSRIKDTNLSIVEMLEIILNHKRSLYDALRLEEIGKYFKVGMAIV